MSYEYWSNASAGGMSAMSDYVSSRSADVFNASLSSVLLLFAIALVSLHFLATKASASSKSSSTKVKITHQGDGTVLEALSHLALFVFSHFVCYYLWWSAEFNHGRLGNPLPLDPQVIAKAMPNTLSVGMYGALILSQLLFAVLLPGPTVIGFPIPQEHNRRLPYKCNGLAGWYLSLLLGILAHTTGIFDLKLLHANSGAMLTTAVLFADMVAIFMYLECIRTRRSDGTLQYLPHDFVMGQYLNPRLYTIDLKLWAEIRVSWLLLFALDVSCALHYYDQHGYLSNRMGLYLFIHTLYANACMKGEESIPYTWDIFQECWGWMLIYWNFAGVAFAYTFNGRFLHAQGDVLDELPTYIVVLLVILVLAAYWIFDEANAQKNRFRAKQLEGAYVERPWAIPQMPNSTLQEPVRYLRTSRGSTLLMDGWWKYARKPHYAADMILSLLLCIPCGFQHALPYFFLCFFVPMLIHREVRDSARCAEKYGDDWIEYCKQVPYVFIPGIY